jgi:hypothetical protein
MEHMNAVETLDSVFGLTCCIIKQHLVLAICCLMFFLFSLFSPLKGGQQVSISSPSFCCSNNVSQFSALSSALRFFFLVCFLFGGWSCTRLLPPVLRAPKWRPNPRR